VPEKTRILGQPPLNQRSVGEVQKVKMQVKRRSARSNRPRQKPRNPSIDKSRSGPTSASS